MTTASATGFVHADETIIYLLTKPAVRLRTEHTCTADIPVDRGPGREPGPCARPIWGDGTVDGVRFDMCSRCWHFWAAFHSHYRLFQANPAAAAITDSALERLFVDRGLDGSS